MTLHHRHHHQIDPLYLLHTQLTTLQHLPRAYQSQSPDYHHLPPCQPIQHCTIENHLALTTIHLCNGFHSRMMIYFVRKLRNHYLQPRKHHPSLVNFIDQGQSSHFNFVYHSVSHQYTGCIFGNFLPVPIPFVAHIPPLFATPGSPTPTISLQSPFSSRSSLSPSQIPGFQHRLNP